jgi:hypothetical protein
VQPDFRVYLDSNISNPPKEYKGFEIELNFENPDEVHASLTADKVTFTGAEADYLNAIKNNGGLGVYWGVPLRLELESEVLFNGYIDLSDEACSFSCEEVIVKIREHKNLDWFEKTADGFGFDLLYSLPAGSLGRITTSDFVKIPYILSEIPDYKDAAIYFIYAYVLGRELQNILKDLTFILSDLTGVFTTIAGILKLIFFLVYLVTLFIAIVVLVKQLLATLIQPVKYHYGMMFQTHFEKFCEYLGLNFSSSIFMPLVTTGNELSPGLWESLCLMPEKSKEGFQKNKTTLQTGFFIGTIGDFVRTCSNMFNAKFIIVNGTFHFERVDFGSSTATYTIPDVRRESHGINASELVSNYLVEFRIDNLDLNTINRYNGTNAKNVTTSKVKDPNKSELIHGYKKPDISFALGRGKRELTRVEELLKDLLNVLDTLFKPIADLIGVIKQGIAGTVKAINKIIGALNALPGVNINKLTVPSSSKPTLNLSGAITNRIDMLALSGDFTGVPKVFLVDGSGWNIKIASDNESKLTAENLWKWYHYLESMVPSTNKPNGNQAEVNEMPVIPFCIDDYKLIKGNSIEGPAKVLSPEGNQARIRSLKWNFWFNKASIKYAESKLFTDNLQEQLLINTGE